MLMNELNIFLSIDKPFEKGCSLDFYSIGELPLGQERYTILRFLSRKILGYPKLSHVTWYTPSLKENYFVVLPNSLDRTDLTIENYTLKYVGTRELSPTLPSCKQTLSRLLYQSARRNLSRSGLWKRYYNVYIERKPLVTSSQCEIYRGFRFRIDIFSDGRVGLILDPTTTLVSRSTLWERIQREGVETIQKWIRTKTKKERKVKIGKNVFEYRAKRVSRLVGLDTQRTVNDRSFINLVTNQLTSVIEYQRSRYGISSINPSEPIALIKYGEDLPPSHHAPSLLKPTMTTEEISPQLQSKYVFLSPDERRNTILDYVHILANLRFGKTQIEFNNKMATPSELEFGRMWLPSLVFGGSKRVKIERLKDLRKIKTKSLTDYGPYEKSPIMEICLIYRTDFDRDIIFGFYEDLRNYMKRYYRVPLSRRPKEMVTKDYYDLAEKIHEFREKMKNSFFIVFFPSKEASEYDFIKDKLPAPSQGIAMESVYLRRKVEKAANFERKKLQGIYNGIVFTVATGIFVQAGGIPWILGDHLHADCHIGIDIGGKEAKVACYGYLFDKTGRIIGTDVGYAQKGELVESSRMKRAIKKLLSLKLKPKENMKIMITRDGRLLQEERQGIIEAIEELFLQQMKETLSLSIVEMRKDVPYRIFERANGQTRNPKIGSFAITDINTGILCTTGYPLLSQGVAGPLLIYMENLFGQTNIREVLCDILYLSQLNWIAGDKASKLPVTINLAEKRAIFAEKGITPASRLPV